MQHAGSRPIGLGYLFKINLNQYKWFRTTIRPSVCSIVSSRVICLAYMGCQNIKSQFSYLSMSSTKNCRICKFGVKLTTT